MNSFRYVDPLAANFELFLNINKTKELWIQKLAAKWPPTFVAAQKLSAARYRVKAVSRQSLLKSVIIL